MSVILPSNQIYGVKSDVLENADLLRVIGEYLIDVQLPFILSFKAVRNALKPLNHLSGEKWIRSYKRRFVTSVSMIARAQSLGCEFNLTIYGNNFFTYAASNGSVDVLRWLHQKYPPNQYSAGVRFDVCCAAAINGHIEVLEHLKSLGNIVDWDETVCAYTVRGGHLHILQWLREVLDPPCLWNEYSCHEAASHGHLYILQWLRAQDPPCPWRKQDCIDKARNKNHHEVVEWILSQPE